MVKLATKLASINSFFEFAAGVNPFDLIDIVNDAEKQTENDFAQANGEYEYKIHFLVDETMTTQLNVIGVRINIFTADPRTQTLTTGDAIKTCEIRFSTPAATPQKIDGMPPAPATTSWQGNVVGLLVSKQANLKLPAGVIVPGYQAKQPASSLKQVSKEVHLTGGDPAAMAGVGLFSSITPQNAISLDSANAQPTAGMMQLRSTGASNRGRRSLASLRNELRRQKRSGQSNKVTEALVRPSQTTAPAAVSFVELAPSKKEYERIVSINKQDVSGVERLFASLSVIQGGQTGRTFEKKVIEIQHGKELTEFLANPVPPDLSLASVNFSSATLRLQKVDPTLRTVRVFRIVTNPNLNRVVVDDVADLSFDGDNALLFTDDIDNIKPNKTAYRVAVVNSDGSIGEFTSIVIPTFKKLSDPLNSAAVPVTIRATNTFGAVRIKVATLTDDIYTLRLLRQELGKTGAFSDSVEVIPSADDENLTIVAGQISSFEFADKTSILGRKYRYFVALRVGQPGMTSLGEEVISDEDEVLVRKFYTGTVPFAISVSDPTLEQGSDESSTISFEIAVEQTTDLFSAVITSLQDAGIGAEFISSLQQDDIKTKLFTMFLVERFEDSTGRRVSFGVVPAGRFVDSPTTRAPRSIPPPRVGESYEYIIKTCLQQPEVFLQSSNVGLINRYGDEIKRKASRFARLIYDRLGVLPPEADVRDGKSIEDLLLESQIGQENQTKIYIPSSYPTIGNLAVLEKSFYNSLTWRVSGNIDNISYFLVYCTLSGNKQLLGSVACSRSTPLYMFRDDRLFAEVGEKSYSIEAVSFNDDEVATSAPAASNKLFSIPENLVVGTMFSSFGNKTEIQPVAPEDFSPPAKKASLPPLIPVIHESVPDAPRLSTFPVKLRQPRVMPLKPPRRAGIGKPKRFVRVPTHNESRSARALAANVETHGRRRKTTPQNNTGRRL